MARGPTEAARRNAKLLADKARRMRAPRPASERTARWARDVIESAYAAEREPSGGKWAKLRYRKPPPKPLQLTGESKSSVKITAQNDGSIRFWAAPYLYFHMSGFVAHGNGAVVPKRNPTPFELRDGKWMAKPALVKRQARHMREWIDKGIRS